MKEKRPAALSKPHDALLTELRGLNSSALTRMAKFAEVFPDEAIVSPLATQLSWSHFIEILPLKQPLKREYYAELCRVERWSVRTEQVDLMDLSASNIRVAEYLAHIPDMKVLQAQLHRAVQMARERAAQATLLPVSGDKTPTTQAIKSVGKPKAACKKEGDAA
jgi:hypothetical protein